MKKTCKLLRVLELLPFSDNTNHLKINGQPQTLIKSIKFKLWLTFFITLVLSLGAVLVLTQLSVKNRFLEYATSQILQRLAPLEAAVAESYTTHHSLYQFTENPQLWSTLRDTTYREYLRLQTSRMHFKPDQQWNSRQALAEQIKSNQRIFFQHLVLYDHNKILIAGSEKINAQYILRDVLVDERLIGFVGYVKPEAFLSEADKLFIDQQLQSFITISIVIIFTSLLFSLWMSRWLIHPLTQLSDHAKKLAAGDFHSKITHQSKDELGELCRNFNEMAHSLRMNEEARKQWVADISHEMRTPLSVIKAQIEAMEDGIRETSPENLALLSKNTTALNTIISDLYELSLSDLGALTYTKTLVDVSLVLEDAINNFRNRAQDKKLEMIYQPHTHQSIEIFADVQRIVQLFTNILENSIRYTEAPGKIVVELTLAAPYVRIEINDSKPGVPDSSIDKIFDRLYRIDDSRNRNYGGAGLGLSICKNIVDAHNGHISASHSPLGGLNISIDLPMEIA